MRISDWSSDVCSSDLKPARGGARWNCYWAPELPTTPADDARRVPGAWPPRLLRDEPRLPRRLWRPRLPYRAESQPDREGLWRAQRHPRQLPRSEEHTSELQSLMRNSYAVFCLTKKNTHNTQHNTKELIQ